MGKLLLPDFAMTKSLLPQANSKILNRCKNSGMGALWFSNCSHSSHQQSLSEPPAYKLLATGYDADAIIVKLHSILFIPNGGYNFLNFLFVKIKSAFKSQRNYLNFFRNKNLMLKPDKERIGINLLSTVGLFLFNKYGGSSTLLILSGSIFALSFYAAPFKRGINLRIILNN